MSTVTVGIAQFSASHLNLQESLDRLETIVAEAARRRVQLLTFGETWLSGYPAWLDYCRDVAHWDYEPMKVAYAKLHASAISVGSIEFDRLRTIAKKHGIVLCLGINEKLDRGPGSGTLYNSILIIDELGVVQNHHRKLVPTYTEKMMYGQGDGFGLRAVETSFGRLTASICWEHWMPMTRQVLHDQGEHLHVALWPTVNEMHLLASRHYAFEGRCFVLAVGQMLRAFDFPPELQKPATMDENVWVLRGGSCVIGPTGQCLTTPLFDQEELITLTLNLDDVVKERMTLDTTGHYQRPDVFSYTCNRTRPTWS